MDVRGKVVIVTGASEGIGRAVSVALATAGARLCLAARSAEKLQGLAQELTSQGCEALALPTDMRDRQQVERLVVTTFSHFGEIDILINNAGQGMAGLVENGSFDDYQQLLELNVFGPVYAMQAVIPKMREAGGGMIVNVSSVVSKMHIPGLGFYASTKAALDLLSDTARVELEQDMIRVLTVFPRMTSTDFGKNSRGDQALRQRQRAAIAAHPIPVDSAEHVADRILQAIASESTEQYME